MKHDVPTAEELKNALPSPPAGFSARMHATLCALTDERKEKKKMKKKLSAGLILALILALLACAALALTPWRKQFETLVSMENAVGYYDEWDLESKLRLLSMMEENGVAMDAALLERARNDALSEQTRGKAADDIIAGRYGRNGRVDTVSVLGMMQTELGCFDDWPIADMAWYSRLDSQSRCVSPDYEMFVTPAPGDATQRQATEKAYAALRTHRGLAQSDLADAKLCVKFKAYPYTGLNDGKPMWYFEWYRGDVMAACVQLYADGSTAYVMDAEPPMASPDEQYENGLAARREALLESVGAPCRWSVADWHAYRPDYYALPEEGDVAPERVRALVCEALIAREGYTQAELNGMLQSMYKHVTSIAPGDVRQYDYTVAFYPDENGDVECSASVNAQTGEITYVYRREKQ